MIGWTEAQTWLGAPDSAQTLVMQLVQEGHAYLESITSRTFRAKASFTAYVDGLGSRSLWLPDPPVIPTAGGTLAASVTVERETGTAWETVTATDYRINDRELVLTAPTATWTRGRQNYRVTYTRGYTAGSEPDLARYALKLWLTREYNSRTGGDFKSETIGDYSYTMADTGSGGESKPLTLEEAIDMLRGTPAIA